MTPLNQNPEENTENDPFGDGDDGFENFGGMDEGFSDDDAEFTAALEQSLQVSCATNI